MDENTQNTVSDNQSNTQPQDFDINSFIGVGEEVVQETPTQEVEDTTSQQAPVEQPEEVTTPEVQGSEIVEGTPAVDMQVQVEQPQEISTPEEIQQSQDMGGTMPVDMQAQESVVQPEEAIPSPAVEQTVAAPVQTGSGFTPNPDELNQILNNTEPVESVQPEVQAQPVSMETEPEVQPTQVAMPEVEPQSPPAFMPEAQASAPSMPSDLSQPLNSEPQAPDPMNLVPPTPSQPDEIVSTLEGDKSGKGGTAVVIVLIIVIVALLITIGYFALQIFG